MAHDVPSDQTNEGRRRFIELCIGGMGVASAGAVAFPVVSFLGRPVELSVASAVELPVADLHEDQAQYVDHRGQQIVVLYTQREPKVLSASCSHLGCLVTWDHTKHVLRCPCHGAVFDDQGQPVSGPVSQPLAKVPFEVKDGKIVIG